MNLFLFRACPFLNDNNTSRTLSKVIYFFKISSQIEVFIEVTFIQIVFYCKVKDIFSVLCKNIIFSFLGKKDIFDWYLTKKFFSYSIKYLLSKFLCTYFFPKNKYFLERCSIVANNIYIILVMFIWYNIKRRK